MHSRQRVRVRAGVGRSWWERTGSPSWTGGAVALATTAALFIAAIVAMTTVRTAGFENSRRRDQTAVVRLTFPTPPAKPVPRARRVEPPAKPTVPPPPIMPAIPPIVTPEPRAHGPPARREPVIDTSAAATTATPQNTSSLRPPAPRGPGGGAGAAGAGMAPAGVTTHTGVLSSAARDSIAARKLAGIPAGAWTRPLSKEELAEVRAQREPGLSPTARAARLPGEPVYAPLMNGGYTVAITAKSFSLRRDRTKEIAIDNDNQLRLRRLQDRLLLRQDSIRADSLRRDSIARNSRP